MQAGAAAPAGDASAAAAAQPSHGISDATIVKNSMKHYPRVTHGEHKIIPSSICASLAGLNPKPSSKIHLTSR